MHASALFNPKPQAMAPYHSNHACPSFNPKPQAMASYHSAHASGLRLNELQVTARPSSMLPQACSRSAAASQQLKSLTH